jgi:putative aldouronate transport system substrate-binding protein
MQHRIKKILIIALSLMLLFASAGCGGTVELPPSPGASATATPKPSEEPSADASEPAESSAPAGATREFVEVPAGDWKTPYAQTVNITGAMSMGQDWVFENGDDVHNNPWTRAWKDELNIEVTWDWVETGGSQYDTKLNMSIAAGDVPDAFKVNYVQYRQLRAADLILDVGEEYRTVASQRLRDYEKEDPDTIKLTSEGDSIYAIPNYYYGQIDAPKWLWVRKDWYEAAGSPELKTVADFENLAKQFVAEHGGYGMGIDNALTYLYMTGPMFGVYLGDYGAASNPYFWYKDDTGRIKAGETHPEMKTALANWTRWFQEGILSADFANTDDNRMNEEIVNGKTGFQPFWQWQGWMNGPNLVAAQGSNDAYMIPLPFPTMDGSQVLGQIGFPNGANIVVSKECKNPAAVLKLLSFTDYVMFDPNTVLTEEQFKGFTDGQREHAPGAFTIIDPRADMLQYEHVSEAMKTGDTSKLFTAGMKKKYADSIAWRDEQNPGGLGAYLQQGRIEGCSYYLSKQLLDAGHVIRTDLWGPPPEAFDQTANTSDVLAMGFTQIIMGARPIDDYEAIIAEWYAGGGQILEDAVNAEYGN